MSEPKKHFTWHDIKWHDNTEHGKKWLDVINDLTVNEAYALVEGFLRLFCRVEINHFIWEQPAVAVVNARFDYTVPMQLSDTI